MQGKWDLGVFFKPNYIVETPPLSLWLRDWDTVPHDCPKRLHTCTEEIQKNHCIVIVKHKNYQSVIWHNSLWEPKQKKSGSAQKLFTLLFFLTEALHCWCLWIFYRAQWESIWRWALLCLQVLIPLVPIESNQNAQFILPSSLNIRGVCVFKYASWSSMSESETQECSECKRSR